MTNLLKTFFGLLAFLSFFISPVFALRDSNSYDGNIFPIYAGNGSLVPPSSSIRRSIENGRTSVVIYYLDDSSTSKAFAPVVSGLKLLWENSIDLIPLTTDELELNNTSDPLEASYYWHGHIPQVVVLDGKGSVTLDQEGQVPIETINNAIVKASGLNPPSFSITIKTFNDYNSEPSKEGYTAPRQQAKSN